MFLTIQLNIYIMLYAHRSVYTCTIIVKGVTNESLKSCDVIPSVGPRDFILRSYYLVTLPYSMDRLEMILR